MAIDNIPNLAWLKTAPPLQKRRAAAEAKCHSDRLESAAHMRRVDAEAKAMAIGNIADVLRLKTVSPLQKCVCRKAGKDCYCSQGVGAGDKQRFRAYQCGDKL